MERTVFWGDREISYTLERKRVKNINLRVRADGSVYVSASDRVPLARIDEMVLRNGERILTAVAGMNDRVEKQKEERDFPKEETEMLFASVMEKMYPSFEKHGVPFPVVRIRKMKSRWGSCIPAKKVVTLNSRLMNYSLRCIEYVVVHELCHFLEPNHSPRFYKRMTEVMPDWEERKRELNCGPVSGVNTEA